MTDRRPLTLDEPLLDAHAIAILLGVEADTVYAWATSGRASRCRCGIAAFAVDSWLPRPNCDV